MKYFFLSWMLLSDYAYVKPNIDYQENFVHDYKHQDNSNNKKFKGNV